MDRSRSPSISPPPAPRTHRSSRQKRRHRGYSLPRGEKSPRRRSEVTLLLCVLNTTSHKWHTSPLRFDPNRINDRELWTDIRYIFRTDLHPLWKRVLGFKRVKSIVPIGYSPNGVPVRIDPKDYPDAKQFTHAFHHPEDIHPDHHWVDWFVAFNDGDERKNGLEFVEGLYAEKLLFIAILATIGIIVTCIVWCVLGGQLQTVFTVMSFVLSLIADCAGGSLLSGLVARLKNDMMEVLDKFRHPRVINIEVVIGGLIGLKRNHGHLRQYHEYQSVGGGQSHYSAD